MSPELSDPDGCFADLLSDPDGCFADLLSDGDGCVANLLSDEDGCVADLLSDGDGCFADLLSDGDGCFVDLLGVVMGRSCAEHRIYAQRMMALVVPQAVSEAKRPGCTRPHTGAVQIL